MEGVAEEAGGEGWEGGRLMYGCTEWMRQWVEIFGRKRIAAPAGCCTNIYISIVAVVFLNDHVLL